MRHLESSVSALHLMLSLICRNNFTGSIPKEFLTSSKLVCLVDLKNNSLTDGVPESLDILSKLGNWLEGNQLSALASLFCDNSDWMGGNVGRFKSCDSSSGTANPSG